MPDGPCASLLACELRRVCPPESSANSPVPSPTTPASAAAPDDIFEDPQIDDLYSVDGGREVALRCWGAGSPPVVIEGGHPTPEGGIAQFEGFGHVFVETIAERTTVCAYDRAGTGLSDAAPKRPRTADDVVRDLRAVLRGSELEGPYVLVGSSFGGMIVRSYASKYPRDTAGVALLDVPAPSDELSLKDIPELAWDHPIAPRYCWVKVTRHARRFPRSDDLREFVHRQAPDSSSVGAETSRASCDMGLASRA